MGLLSKSSISKSPFTKTNVVFLCPDYLEHVRAENYRNKVIFFFLEKNSHNVHCRNSHPVIKNYAKVDGKRAV